MLTTHSACNVVYRYGSRGLEFLVMDYQSTDPKTQKLTPVDVRFPAGTSQSGEFGESTEETSVRKLKEETGLDALDTERIGRKPAGEGHEKYAFLIAFKDCLGSLRDTPQELHGDKMSNLRWVPVSELRNKIAPVHFWVYRAARERLKRRGHT